MITPAADDAAPLMCFSLLMIRQKYQIHRQIPNQRLFSIVSLIRIPHNNYKKASEYSYVYNYVYWMRITISNSKIF